MSDRTLGVLASAAAAALFGSAYVATAFQLHGFTPLGAALWRTGLAAVVLAAILAGRRLAAAREERVTDADGIERPTSERPASARVPSTAARATRLLVIGVLGGLVFIVGMNLAVSQVGSTIASFVAGLYAITGALFAPVVLRERLSGRAVVGFIVALLGTALLAELGPSPSALGGLAAGGMAAVSFGLYLDLVRRWSRAIAVGPVGISLAAALVTAVGLAGILAVTAPRSMLPHALGAEVVVSTAWLVAVAAIGPLLTTVALRRIEAPLASSLLLVNPVTATVLAAVLLGERPSGLQLVGGLLVLTGMGTATDVVGAIRRRRAGPVAAVPPAV